jgi:hypothetical protein
MPVYNAFYYIVKMETLLVGKSYLRIIGLLAIMLLVLVFFRFLFLPKKFQYHTITIISIALILLLILMTVFLVFMDVLAK